MFQPRRGRMIPDFDWVTIDYQEATHLIASPLAESENAGGIDGLHWPGWSDRRSISQRLGRSTRKPTGSIPDRIAQIALSKGDLRPNLTTQTVSLQRIVT